MSSYSDSTPPQSQGGDSGKDKYECDPPTPTPTPPPECPNPCDKAPDFGPPQIRQECCESTCCSETNGKDDSGDKYPCCTWFEIDDPCVKAASADCNTTWTKIECNCSSSNKDCDCSEWDCGCYPQSTCVPCKPCEDFLPPENGDGDGGDCGGNGTDDCTSDNLRKQLDELTQCISSQQNRKAKLEADMKAAAERQKALTDLIKAYDDIVKKYREQRYKLICKEDCLKGFFRDVSAEFKKKYADADLKKWMKAINDELCRDELAKCCQKNLEGKLSKATKLDWTKQQAEKDMKKADQAFTIIKDLPKWIDDQFTELEKLTDDIGKALNDPDPQKQKWAFYLFYWKFAPGLCRCFPYRFCCNGKPPGSEEPGQTGQQQQQQQQGKQEKSEPKSTEEQTTPNDHASHLGCAHGDWHPSAITEDVLKQLICCAWEYARARKEDYLNATDEVNKVTNNLESIKKKVEGDSKTLEERIKRALEKASNEAATAAQDNSDQRAR
jgi:hypothetical protein